MIKFKDIRNYIEGNLNAIRDSKFENLDPGIKREALLREQLCPECTDNGKCVICGCSTPNMYYAPHKTCSKGRWLEMQEDWEEYEEKIAGELGEEPEEGKIYLHTMTDGSVVQGELLEISSDDDREEYRLRIDFVYLQNDPKYKAGKIVKIIKLK